MSTQLEITRLQKARNDIRDKLVELGLAESTSKLDTLATAVSGIENKGALSATVKEGETYTIPKGYHNGSGTVSGVSGGGNYELQSKTITPTKSQQNVTPDVGYYGLSDVTVSAIPESYQNVSSVTADAEDVLTGKVIVKADGTVTAGTMPNNGGINRSLNTTTTSFTIPKGYHSGAGVVSITTESKTVTPTKSAQNVTPTEGKVLSGVVVNAIPNNYIDTSDATAAAKDILVGKTAYIDGVLIEGTMADNGDVSATIDGLTTLSYSIPAGFSLGGTVSLTNDIENALAAI